MSNPVCAFQISELKKAITKKRKQLRVVGPKGKVQLQELLLGHKGLPHVAQALDKDGVFETLSIPKLRRLWKQVAEVYHKAVSKMSANKVIEYLYFTADKLDWDWTTVLQGRDTKKRVSKACENSAQPGDTTSAPASILRKTRDPNAPKRALSAYQQYMKDELANMKGNRRFALLTHKDRFAYVAKEWKRFKEGQANEQHQRDIAAEDAREETITKAPMRAALKKVGKIPKKNEALSKAKAAAARVSARTEAEG
jgi:hypothetical protein